MVFFSVLLYAALTGACAETAPDPLAVSGGRGNGQDDAPVDGFARRNAEGFDCGARARDVLTGGEVGDRALAAGHRSDLGYRPEDRKTVE